LKIDVTKNTQDDKVLLKKFNLFGPPAVVIFEDGKEIKRKKIIGFVKPKEFLQIINKN
jgi:thiol:disulfide interchange protein DsbD